MGQRHSFTLSIAAAVLATSCQRMAWAPCPAVAAPLEPSRPADDRTTAWYFDGRGREDAVLRHAAADLVWYREPPLATLASDAEREAYRLLRTGPLGNVVAVHTANGEHVMRTAQRRLCEDNDFGVTTCRSTLALDLREWAAFSACMQLEFWGHATPDDDMSGCVRGFTVAQAPGGHEASTVVSELPVTVVEGVLDGEHRVRTFSAWEPRGRHARLAYCFESAQR